MGPNRHLAITEPARPELRGNAAPSLRGLKTSSTHFNAQPGGQEVGDAFSWPYKLLRTSNSLIIAVPQTVIARGFVKDWKLSVAGTRNGRSQTSVMPKAPTPSP